MSNERLEPRDLAVLARTICEEAQVTDDIVQVRADVIRMYNIVVQMTDDNERLRAERDALQATIRGLYSCIDDAREIVNIGVALMPIELLGDWHGVRSWQEQAPQAYLRRARGELTDTVSDGFGTVSAATCPDCGAPMRVIRPGDIRCSAECYYGIVDGAQP